MQDKDNLSKEYLREKYIKQRKQLSIYEIADYSHSIQKNVFSLPILNHTVFHIFLPIENKNEVNTYGIMQYLLDTPKTVVLPRVLNTQLEHVIYTDDMLIKKSKWGIPEPVGGKKIEPVEIDVVFVPLLAVDKKGNRVGYGGGYYDQFLSQCSKGCIKIGLGFFNPIHEDVLLADPWDIMLDYYVSPTEVYSYRKS